MTIQSRRIISALALGIGVADVTGLPANAWTQPHIAPARLATHARMVSAVDVRIRRSPSFEAPVDSLVPLGTVVIVNDAKQPRDTSWVYVELRPTGAPGYIHSSMMRRILPRGGPAMAEEIATERLARRGDPFHWRLQVFQMLTYQLDVPTESERQGRFGLLWIRTFASMLASIPPGEHEVEPYRSWFLDQVHPGFINLNDSTGTWDIGSASLFTLHDRYRETRSADEIAWTIRQMGGGHRCGPSVACNIAWLDSLDAEYLRRHPDGSHAIEAFARIRAVTERALGEPAGAVGFHPRSDCEALAFSVASVRAAVANATIAPRAGFRGVPAIVQRQTLAVLDKQAARCPQ